MAGAALLRPTIVFATAKVAHPNFRAPRPGASVQANRRINGEGRSDGRLR
jgi:hypothetical protein